MERVEKKRREKKRGEKIKEVVSAEKERRGSNNDIEDVRESKRVNMESILVIS